MTNDISLAGCTPTPLAAYLKAVAVLRLVAEQAGDPDARAFWSEDTLVLRTHLSREALLAYFLERYRPTPMLTPWNGGSGFYPGDNRHAIDSLRTSRAGRFTDYRDAIATAECVLDRLGAAKRPPADAKPQLLQALRNVAPEPLLRWMDAAVILTNDGPGYPPLLGTGGNDGRLDFTNNFMQRLLDVVEPLTGAPTDQSPALLAAALNGSAVCALSSNAIGQFSPGAAGGPNAGTAFEAEPRINPWDFVLMLEGAVAFAAAAARRLDSTSPAAMAAPFTVRSRQGATGAASSDDDATARGEFWAPLWTSPLSASEVAALLTEGRAVVGRRAARDGLDFARAVARLGVDRGIASFQRFVFQQRSGKAYLATPTDRIPVQRNPDADLLDELESGNWLARVQKHARDRDAGSAYVTAAGRLDAALISMARRRERMAVQRVLVAVGRLLRLAAVSHSLRSALPAMPALSAAWAARADDGSTEYRIAMAVAGLSLSGKRHGGGSLPLRCHLAPLTPDGSRWDAHSPSVCWADGPLEPNLVRVLRRRRLDVARLGADGELLSSAAGATLDDVAAFLHGHVSDARIAELVPGLACVHLDVREPEHTPARASLPFAWHVLAPFFVPEGRARSLGWLPHDRRLSVPGEMIARLASGDVPAALRIAWARLRALDVPLPTTEPPAAPGLRGRRLLAALAIPLTYRDAGRALEYAGTPKERDSAATE